MKCAIPVFFVSVGRLARASFRFIALAFTIVPVVNAADWPHWRGPERNDIVAESSGWDGKTWIKGDLWQLSVGAGSSSPIVVGDRVYLTGWSGNRDSVYCVHADTGKVLWRQTYSSPRYGRFAVGDQRLYSGACSTPEYDVETRLLFTLGVDGDLNAWDTVGDGQRVWGFNIYDRYGAQRRPEVAVRRKTRRDYGYMSSPLVVGNQLIVEVGGRTGNLVGLDKPSGRELWLSKNRDEAGHTGGPVPMTVEGIPCVAVLTLRNLVVTRIDGQRAGQTVAVFPWTTDFANNIPTPAVHGDSVIVTSAYNRFAVCRVKISLSGAKKVWENKEVASGVCSPIIHEGRVYWAWRGVHCLDVETGKELWTGGKIGSQGSCVVTSDNRLVVYGNKGELFLVESAKRSPSKYAQLAASRVFSRTDAWPHVVLANGRLICRDRNGAVRCLATSSDLAAKMKVQVATKPASKPIVRPSTPVTPPANLDLTNWPGKNDPGLFYGWKRGMGKAAPLGAIAKSQPRLLSRDGAKFDDAGRMVVNGGSFHVQDATAPLLAAAKKTGQLTIETILTTANLRQVGPARILTFSTDGYHRNFTFGQEREQLLLRLRTPRTGANGMNPQSILGSLEANKPLHILVTYRDGELVAYVNGKRVYKSNRVTGDFSNWDAKQQLVFGAEFRDGRNWDGVFDGIAILTRFVGPEEAVARYQSAIGKARAVSKPTPKPDKPATNSPRPIPLPSTKQRLVTLPFSATLHAGSVDRQDAIAELSIDLKSDSRRLDVTSANGQSLRNQWMPQTGTLFVEIPGPFAANSSRTIRVSRGTSNLKREPDVLLTEAGVHEGSDSWRIQNATGNWFFAKTGGGFGSIEDTDGNDWINYHQQGGSAGNYRGLPNLVHPEGIFHAGSGKGKCTTTVLAGGPLSVSLQVSSVDGKWVTRWDIFKRHARCTVLKAAHPYWFLYEGTPGGKLDLDGNDVVYRDGRQSSAAAKWQGSSHRWVAFGDRKAKRSLLLVHETSDQHEDSYWPMQGNMTVFGFGRSGLRKFMTSTPNVFHVSLQNTVQASQLRTIADQRSNPLTVTWPE